jgi:hypothetical protein
MYPNAMVDTPKAIDMAQEITDKGGRAIAHVDGQAAEVEMPNFGGAAVPWRAVEVAADESTATIVVTYDDRLVIR